MSDALALPPDPRRFPEVANTTALRSLEQKVSLVRSAALLVVVLTLPEKALQPQYAHVFPYLVLLGCAYILLGGLLPFTTPEPRQMASLMVVCDLMFCSMLVQATGGIDSGYLALYYLPVLRAAVTMQLRDALATAGLAVALTGYLAVLHTHPAGAGPDPYWRLVSLDLSLLAMALVFALVAQEGRSYHSAVAKLSHATIRLHEQSSQLREMAQHDIVTGVYNRRYIDERINSEIVRAHEGGSRFALVLLEVKGLRRLNDARGSAAGDAALKRLAELLCRLTRRIDTVGRYSGDGFAILLSDTNAAGAEALAARLMAAMEHDPDGLTLLIGYAAFPGTAGNGVELVKEAAAMLSSNRSARFRQSSSGTERSA